MNDEFWLDDEMKEKRMYENTRIIIFDCENYKKFKEQSITERLK